MKKIKIPKINLKTWFKEKTKFFILLFRKKYLTHWLAVLVILLGLWLTKEMFSPLGYSQGQETVFEEAETFLLAGAEIPPFFQYAKALRRELFKPAQQATRKGGIAKIGIEAMVKKLSLSGTVSVGNKLQALITWKGEGTSLYNEGDTVVDFTIKKIERNRAILEFAGQEIILVR